ncbi:MAG: hypothetical protein M1817_005586 [Caeruleum heppii]|nr:MAG: hypothetical protein M1817_005586 [Caeruleum heppii]
MVLEDLPDSSTPAPSASPSPSYVTRIIFRKPLTTDDDDNNNNNSDPSNPTPPANNNNVLYIDPATLPQPLLRPRDPDTQSNPFEANLAERVRSLSRSIGRPLSRDEAEAVVQHTARGSARASYFAPVGMLVGLYRAHVTRKTGKLPGIPTSRIDPTAHPLLWSGWGRAFWYVVRYAGYMWLGAAVAGTVGLSYGSTVATVGIGTDVRLKGVTRDIKARMMQRSSGLPGRDETSTQGQGRRPAAPVQMSTPTRPKGVYGDEDDASPTAAGDEFSDETTRSARPSGGVLSEVQRRRQDMFQQGSRRSSEEIPSESSSNDDDPFIPPSSSSSSSDASPSTSSPSSSTPPSTTAGSSWARIRQQASASNPSSDQPTSEIKSPFGPYRGRPGEVRDNEAGPGAQSFSFERGEADRQLAREEAQRAFDARVERERRGDEF